MNKFIIILIIYGMIGTIDTVLSVRWFLADAATKRWRIIFMLIFFLHTILAIMIFSAVIVADKLGNITFEDIKKWFAKFKDWLNEEI